MLACAAMMPPKRLLIVDDDDVDRETLLRLLRRLDFNFEVVEASGLEEATEALHRGCFDCVMLDYQLKDSIGLQLLPAVREHRTELCPVILVTLRESESLIVDAMRCGVSDYVSKAGLNTDKLREVLHRTLDWAQAEQAKIEAQRLQQQISAERQREHEASLRVAVEQAENANRAKSQFLAHISHEIRTPMNAVIGLTYLLERTQLNTEQGDLVDKIKLAGKTLLSLINDVLDLSRIEASELHIEQASFDLHEMLHQLSQLTASDVAAKRIDFRMEVPADIPRMLIGDAVRVHQVLLNLLSNAVKFTERGAVRLIVRLRARGDHGVRLLFAVRDTGVGIAPDALERIFQPFVQADGSTTRRYGGSGLGLAIVRQLVALMGGNVQVRSTLGRGSEFSFEVELGVEQDGATLPTPSRSAPEPRGARLRGVRVLVVDDSAINLEVARRTLEFEGATVRTAGNGLEAVECLLAEPCCVDVVLMDVQMPVLDGYDATRRIRSGLGLRELPIIALTAGTLASQRDQAEACGMNGMVSKPFEVDELVYALRHHLMLDEGAEPPAVPAAAAPPAGWPVIEGVDMRSTADRLCGDLKLFRSLLRRLLQDYGAARRFALTEDSLAEAAARFHTLKGSAGMLGVRRVQYLAARIEAACRARKLSIAIRLESLLHDSLVQLGSDAREFLADCEELEDEAPGLSAAPAGPELIERMIELLDSNDLGVLRLFTTEAAALRERLGNDTFQALRARIDGLEFRGALQLLLAAPQPHRDRGRRGRRPAGAPAA